MNIRDHPFLWQWDRNRALAINEPGAIYVDFDRPGETPDRRAIVDGLAEISDTWLQKAGPKNIYICIQSGTLIGYTLLVRPRPKPADYVTANDEKYEVLKAEMLQRIADTDADLQAHKKAWAEEVERETAELAAMAKKDRQNAEKAQAGIEDLANAIDATYEGLGTLKSRVPDVTLTKAGEAADSAEIGNRLLALERLIGRIRLPPVKMILRSLASALVRAEKSILAKASASGKSKGAAASATVPSQAAGASGESRTTSDATIYPRSLAFAEAAYLAPVKSKAAGVADGVAPAEPVQVNAPVLGQAEAQVKPPVRAQAAHKAGSGSKAAGTVKSPQQAAGNAVAEIKVSAAADLWYMPVLTPEGLIIRQTYTPPVKTENGLEVS